jgi:predicted ATP-dependent serine protease
MGKRSVRKESLTPKWVCFKCGYRAAKRSFEVSAWHMGKCDVCKEWKPVTGPRDFFYPKFTKRKSRSGQ